MTSRRSRLKAVANLPVRRKPTDSTTASNEGLLGDNATPEKVIPNKENEALKSNSITYSAEISNQPSDLQNSSVLKTNYDKCNNEFLNEETNFTKVLICSTDKSNVDTLENGNVITENCNLNCETNNTNDLSTLENNKNDKPSLVGTLQTENVKVNGFNKSLGTLNLEKEKCSVIKQNLFNNNSVTSNTEGDTIKDNITNYSDLPPPTLPISCVSSFTLSSLAPSEEIDIDNETNTLTLSQSQEFEEVQIYTELADQSDFYMNLPNFVANDIIESSEVIIESEESEPVLTPLVTCSERELKKLRNNLNYNESEVLNLKNVPPNKFPKTNSRGTANYGRHNMLKNDQYSKAILADSNNAVAQNLAVEYNTHESIIRKSLTAKRKRARSNDLTKKLADAKKEFQKKFERTRPNRSTLKMIDLIFYNPATNPMESKTKSDKKELPLGQEDVIHERLTEERADDPESMDCSVDMQGSESKDIENFSKMPVPQVKIGLNGEIILDEKSLIIETTEAKKGREDLQNSIPIFEDKGSRISYYRGKTKKTKDWNDFETKRFYKALNTIGPDFSLMQKYFPKRSRLELKNKFKREERFNRHLIDKALNNPSEFDMTLLEKDLAVEKKAEEDEAEMRLLSKMKIRRRVKKPRVKSSLLSREITDIDADSENGPFKSNTIGSKVLSQSEKEKKKNEMNFIFQKLLNKDSEN